MVVIVNIGSQTVGFLQLIFCFCCREQLDRLVPPERPHAITPTSNTMKDEVIDRIQSQMLVAETEESTDLSEAQVEIKFEWSRKVVESTGSWRLSRWRRDQSGVETVTRQVVFTRGSLDNGVFLWGTRTIYEKICEPILWESENQICEPILWGSVSHFCEDPRTISVRIGVALLWVLYCQFSITGDLRLIHGGRNTVIRNTIFTFSTDMMRRDMSDNCSFKKQKYAGLLRGGNSCKQCQWDTSPVQW